MTNSLSILFLLWSTSILVLTGCGRQSDGGDPVTLPEPPPPNDAAWAYLELATSVDWEQFRKPWSEAFLATQQGVRLPELDRSLEASRFTERSIDAAELRFERWPVELQDLRSIASAVFGMNDDPGLIRRLSNLTHLTYYVTWAAAKGDGEIMPIYRAALTLADRLKEGYGLQFYWMGAALEEKLIDLAAEVVREGGHGSPERIAFIEKLGESNLSDELAAAIQREIDVMHLLRQSGTPATADDATIPGAESASGRAYVALLDYLRQVQEDLKTMPIEKAAESSAKRFDHLPDELSVRTAAGLVDAGIGGAARRHEKWSDLFEQVRDQGTGEE